MSTETVNTVIIPSWVNDLLTAQGLVTGNILNYSLVKDALTYEQKVVLLKSQRLACGHFSASDFGACPYALLNRWSETEGDDKDDLVKLRNEIDASEHQVDNLLEEIGLIVSDTAVLDGNSLTDEDTVDVIDLSGNIGLIVGKNLPNLSLGQCYLKAQAMVKILYNYETPFKASSHVVFETYLKLMEKNRQSA